MLDCWHLWLCEANYRGVEELEGTPPRPHLLAYQAPATSLTEGGPVVIAPHARSIACSCELAVEIGHAAYQADETMAVQAIRGYRVLTAFRDSSLIENVPLPTPRDEGVCAYYARWADTFNCVGPLVPLAQVSDPYSAQMRVEIDGFAPVQTSTSDYLHRAPAAVAALSQFATLQPGDIISLGRAGRMVEIAPGQSLVEGTRVRAEIAGVGQVESLVEDGRRR
jgi:5-oxopent-3-ene-1,2,5-tricarboxylate decarboxylase/2-hydroxyhepta-2,4-diene-1,7-dioate isomerase